MSRKSKKRKNKKNNKHNGDALSGDRARKKKVMKQYREKLKTLGLTLFSPPQIMATPNASQGIACKNDFCRYNRRKYGLFDCAYPSLRVHVVRGNCYDMRPKAVLRIDIDKYGTTELKKAPVLKSA